MKSILFLLILGLAGINSRCQEADQTHKTTKTKTQNKMSKITKSGKEWRKELTEKEYRVTREKGTEKAFSGKYWDHKEKGVYKCTCCGLSLFSSETKFKSGTGWPSFYDVIDEDHILEEADQRLGMQRTEVVCARCNAHLGHVFDDGPGPTGLRYVSTRFRLILIKRKRSSDRLLSPASPGN